MNNKNRPPIEIVHALSFENILIGMTDGFKKISAFKIYTYKKGDVLEIFYTSMALINKLPPRKLSWRGVVPLYLNGFGIYEKEESVKKRSETSDELEIISDQMKRKIDYDETEDLLKKFVKAPEHPAFPNYDAVPIKDALNMYESAKNGEDSMFINDNVEDSLKWSEGTIFPEVYPIKRSPVFMGKSLIINNKNHTLKKNVNEIVVYDDDLHCESWLSYRRKVRIEKNAKIRIWPWSPQEYDRN